MPHIMWESLKFGLFIVCCLPGWHTWKEIKKYPVGMYPRKTIKRNTLNAICSLSAAMLVADEARKTVHMGGILFGLSVALVSVLVIFTLGYAMHIVSALINEIEERNQKKQRRKKERKAQKM